MSEPPTVADDTRFIETLVHVLGQARAGKVRGYAMTFLLEREDGGQVFVESGDHLDLPDRLAMLGSIEILKDRYKRRTFGENE